MLFDFDHRRTLDRRELLGRLSAGALFLAAHRAGAVTTGSASEPDGPERSDHRDGHRILRLDLLTGAEPADLKLFYHQQLGLPVLTESDDRIAFAAGETEIRFARTGDATAPFYHFAFNIPENKILAAREWQRERSALFLTPENLRDPDYPDDVRHFRGWNAHSVFFWDPAGNVVEYIARHDLANAAPGPFTGRDILYASEIAFVVDDVPSAAASLRARLGLARYRSESDVFAASGDERGLLLLFGRGREIGDALRGRPAPAAVFPTRARLRGADAASYEIPGYAYAIEVAAEAPSERG